MPRQKSTLCEREVWRQAGLASVEFALCLPFLVSMLFGVVEMTRYVLINQKVDKISVTISDLVGQSVTASTSELNNLALAAGQVMLPYTFSPNGYIIVSSVTQTGAYSISNPPKVSWQYTNGSQTPPGGGSLRTSAVGTSGGSATLPSGFVMNDKDNVIVTEIFYLFSPMVSTTIVGNVPIYRLSIFKPRLGALTTLSTS